MRSAAARIALVGICLAALAPAAQARVGIFFGFPMPYPYYPPPPVYYPPPYYYPPPPTTYIERPPPGQLGQACYAEAYVCPLAQPAPVGTPCSCPAEGGRRVGGYVR